MLKKLESLYQKSALGREFRWAHSLQHLVPKLMDVKRSQTEDVVDIGKRLVGDYDKLVFEMEEMKLAVIAEVLLRSENLSEVESQSISFLYSLAAIIQGLIVYGMKSSVAINLVLSTKDLFWGLLEHNSNEAMDTLLDSIEKNLLDSGFGKTKDLSELRGIIRNYYYRYLSLVSRESINTYINDAEKARETVSQSESEGDRPQIYLNNILELERGIRAPSFAFKPDAIVNIDRNGYRIRVFTGKQLTEEERRILGAYRFAQYADPRIDHDKTKGNQPDIPFFDTDTIYEQGLYTESPDCFTGLPQEYHVIITEPDGRIVGYVGLEAPLSLADSNIRFNDPRPESLQYGLELVFGNDTLSNLTNGELGNEPINSVVDIIRLSPRANTEPEDHLRNSDKLIIAFELSSALTKLIDRLIDEGRKYAICDTEMEKLAQVFAVLLGIMPICTDPESVKPDPSRLQQPYDKLLRTRYIDSEERKRGVSVVAFELEILNSPELRERREEVEILLEQYAKAHTREERKEVLSMILAYSGSTEHMISSRLGRGLVSPNAVLVPEI